MRIRDSGSRTTPSVQSPRIRPEACVKLACQLGMEAEKAMSAKRVNVREAMRVLRRPCQWRSDLCSARRRSRERMEVNMAAGLGDVPSRTHLN